MDENEEREVLRSQLNKLQHLLRVVRCDSEAKLATAQEQIVRLQQRNEELCRAQTASSWQDEALPWASPRAGATHDHHQAPASRQPQHAAHVTHTWQVPRQQPGGGGGGGHTPGCMSQEDLSFIEGEIGALQNQLQTARAKLEFSSWESDVLAAQRALSPNTHHGAAGRARAYGSPARQYHSTQRIHAGGSRGERLLLRSKGNTQGMQTSSPHRNTLKNSRVSHALNSMSPPVRGLNSRTGRVKASQQASIDLLHCGLPTVLNHRATTYR